MIVTDNGVFAIAGWEEYQNADRLSEIREYNRLAKQKSRAKQKQLQSGEINVNDMSMTSQSCQDIEEEKEEEEEKDKEKESHSFIQSGEETCSEEDKERLKLRYMGGTLGQNLLFISDEQFDDLCDRLSFEELHKYIDIVVECEKNGKSYKKKSHYQAILDMVNKDRKVK